MAKLTFFYATMNSGKSLKLIQDEYNFSKSNQRTLVLKPNEDTRSSKITTRFGGMALDAKSYTKKDKILTLIESYREENDNYLPDVIFVDEVQFSSKENIEDFRKIVDLYCIDIFCYGLRTNFMGELFEGSSALFALSDKIIELSNKCSCGKKAIMNVKFDKNKKILKTGNEVECGSEDMYISTCHSCWTKEFLD
jgi:thymidine kinase